MAFCTRVQGSSRKKGSNTVFFVKRENVEGISVEAYLDHPKLLRLIASKTIPLEEEIRVRAYQLYEQRDRRTGLH